MGTMLENLKKPVRININVWIRYYFFSSLIWLLLILTINVININNINIIKLVLLILSLLCCLRGLRNVLFGTF